MNDTVRLPVLWAGFGVLSGFLSNEQDNCRLWNNPPGGDIVEVEIHHGKAGNLFK
jgi:hypothetical protein